MNEFIILTVFCAIASATDVPKWPKMYDISGRLKLPYAEIDEPFNAWYEPTKNRSRVDYYNSTVITIQLGPDGLKTKYGQSYKVAPVFLKEKLQTGCFLVKGTNTSVVSVQAVLPDLTGFKAAGIEKLYGKTCDVWQKTETIGVKKNVYTMWTEKGKPVRYEMMGYDTLLGSHYDKYYLDYDTMNSNMSSFPDALFTPNKGLECGDFPGPGDAEHRVTMNPMQEYIQHVDSHIDDMFVKFKKTHQKHYLNNQEHWQRKHIFRQNVRFIDSKNRAGLSYSLRLNHMADLSDAELGRMRGYRSSHTLDKQALQFNVTQTEIPDHLDWRLYGAVTPVKDQAACGSCWSFGTAETVEGAYFLKTGELVRLSQQELMDCTWDQGNNGCDGGEDFRAYQWILKHGLATEEAYGPYLAQDSYCHYQNVTARAHIKGYANVTTGDLQALKVAVAKHGPISVAIDASHKSLSFYGNGVYFEKDCGSTPDNLDHAVLAVGYGVMNGQAYWLIKNSWSTYWGNDGYVLMSQKDNNCGVATTPTFVLM